MSTQIYTLYEEAYVRRGIHNGVTNEQQALSDFVRRVMRDKSLSYRKVAEKSGGLVAHSTVSGIVNGRVSNLSSQTVEGLAKGLGESETEIYALVRGKVADRGAIADERFASIAKNYADAPDQVKRNLEPLLTAIELTVNQAAGEKGAGTESVGVTVLKSKPKRRAGQVVAKRPERAQLNFTADGDPNDTKSSEAMEKKMFEEIDEALAKRRKNKDQR